MSRQAVHVSIVLVHSIQLSEHFVHFVGTAVVFVYPAGHY